MNSRRGILPQIGLPPKTTVSPCCWREWCWGEDWRERAVQSQPGPSHSDPSVQTARVLVSQRTVIHGVGGINHGTKVSVAVNIKQKALLPLLQIYYFNLLVLPEEQAHGLRVGCRVLRRHEERPQTASVATLQGPALPERGETGSSRGLLPSPSLFVNTLSALCGLQKSAHLHTPAFRRCYGPQLQKAGLAA